VTSPAPGGATAPGGSSEPPVDRLESLRAEVEAVDELSVAERVTVFERVNDGIATELSRLDEV
jgi:hypothetical protein